MNATKTSNTPRASIAKIRNINLSPVMAAYRVENSASHVALNFVLKNRSGNKGARSHLNKSIPFGRDSNASGVSSWNNGLGNISRVENVLPRDRNIHDNGMVVRVCRDIRVYLVTNPA